MSKTSRISIDLSEAGGQHRRIIHSSVLKVVEACGEIYKGLGETRSVVQAFRITFSDFNGTFATPGPTITVFLQDPFGETNSWTTDFRFIGDGSPEPTEFEIIDYLAENLPKFIKEFLEKSLVRLEEAKKMLEAVT